MEKLIIYGLGKSYENLKYFLERQYEIIALCDKEQKKNAILPVQLNNQKDYDKIFVTSNKYFNEIRDELVSLYNIPAEKIIGFKDIFGDFENAEKRHIWVKSKLSAISKGKIILDAGAGEQIYRPFCSHLKYIAQDFGEYVPNQIANGLQMSDWDYSGVDIKSDITSIPLQDKSVDAVLCTEVFEHIPYPVQAIKEFSRLLTKGGVLILTAPVCSLTHMAPYYFYNGFSEFWYRRILEDNGFMIREIQHNGSYFKYLSQELMRTQAMVQKYCGLEMNTDDYVEMLSAVKVMAKYSALDGGSEDTLCFGYMVEAVKK